jgi:hypothetical protein
MPANSTTFIPFSGPLAIVDPVYLASLFRRAIKP